MIYHLTIIKRIFTVAHYGTMLTSTFYYDILTIKDNYGNFFAAVMQKTKLVK